MRTLQFSARAYHRILRLARTIADLSASDRIEPQHISESIHYRYLDRVSVWWRWLLPKLTVVRTDIGMRYYIL